MPVPRHSDIWNIFDKTHTAACLAAAAWYLTNQKQGERPGAAARIGFWELPDRLDHAAPVSTCHGPPGPEQLERGLWEVDETYLSIKDRKNPATPAERKSSTTKVLMVMAVEMVEPKGFGRIRLRRIDRDAATHVIPFVQEVVEPGAQVRTVVRRHTALWETGLHPPRTVMLGSGACPCLHGGSAPGRLTGTALGAGNTYGSCTSQTDLDAYLDEFVFRFNRRVSGTRDAVFTACCSKRWFTPPMALGMS